MPISPDPDAVRLQAALKDLAALSAIPAAWVGREPSDIGAGLADVLVDSLHLDFAFVHLCDPDGGAAVEATRGDAWRSFREWLGQHRSAIGQRGLGQVIPEVDGSARPCRGIVIPVGVHSEGGLVAVASRRADFPNELETLLLSVAANQAATAFRGARLLHERRRAEEALREARDQLETKVAERTAELQRTTVELQEKEARIRRLVDANIIGLSFWDVGGRITEANDAFLRTVGYSRQDLQAGHVSWSAMTPPEYRGADENAIEELMRSGTHPPYEKEYVRKDGSRVVVLLGGAFFEGSRDQGVSFVLDLTERRRTAEALREAQGALARANRAMTLGMLGASIAHEVNQPLGAIAASAAACSRWLSAQPPDLEKAQRSLERIGNDGRRAAAIIHRLRALVKHQVPRKDRFDLNKAILEVLVLMDDEVRRNDILVETSLDADLPKVECDRIQIQQIILNLVVNAIEAMSAVHDRRRQLAIGSAREGANAVRVEVRDSGPGVDASHAERLFEAFYTTKAEGTGMGLSISRAIVEAHGGRLWVNPNGLHGAAFCFSLPVAAPAA